MIWGLRFGTGMIPVAWVGVEHGEAGARVLKVGPGVPQAHPATSFPETPQGFKLCLE